MDSEPLARPAKPREWAPRVWEGADYFAWLRLFLRNRAAVGPKYAYIAAIVSCSTFANTVLRWLQEGLYGERIDAVRFRDPPIFVVGHWRAGTTLLHELLALDDRFTSPTTLQCFAPCHFLLSDDFFRRFLWFLTPDKRPMDNMAAGWDRPQEDEFALALLGLPSTYTDVAFPNRPPMDPGSLDLSGLTPRERAKWERTFVRFLKAVALRDPRRLVLKSPPHTARIPTLRKLFPGAKFVHIKRNPYTLFASTVNLWLSLARKHGFQTPRGGPDVEEKVFREFRTIFERLEEAKPQIPAGDFAEIRYEDLTADLVAGVGRVYADLGLGGFDAVRPKLAEYAARNRGYEPNKWALGDDARAKIRGRWGDIIDRLGYG